MAFKWPTLVSAVSRPRSDVYPFNVDLFLLFKMMLYETWYWVSGGLENLRHNMFLKYLTC